MKAHEADAHLHGGLKTGHDGWLFTAAGQFTQRYYWPRVKRLGLHQEELLQSESGRARTSEHYSGDPPFAE